MQGRELTEHIAALERLRMELIEDFRRGRYVPEALSRLERQLSAVDRALDVAVRASRHVAPWGQKEAQS